MRSKDNGHNNLFSKELEVLDQGMAFLKKVNANPTNELFLNYKKLVHDYKKLLYLSIKVCKISDEQGKIIIDRELALKNLLNNAKQGFLTFGEDLVINGEYSAECEVIFQQKIAQMNILHLLFPNQEEEQIKTYTQVFTSILTEPDKSEPDFNVLPKIITINERSIEISYKHIFQDDHPLMMLILTDVTDQLRSQQQVEYLSYHDYLTSLYNRAYIEKMIPKLFTNENLPLSILFIDMNGLKLTNDVYGHELGDQLIIKTSQILLQSCRESDIIARWGGDEFLIIMPNSDETHARRLKETIKTSCTNVSDIPIEISCSIGVATTNTLMKEALDLIQSAESKMYKEKFIEGPKVRKQIITNLKKRLYACSIHFKEQITRLETMVVQFAIILKFHPLSPDIATLKTLATWQHLGKVGIPESVLRKKEKTDEDWKLIKDHHEIGYRIAQAMEEKTVADAIISLNENWDGTGYPFGLEREEIPYFARIISIINAFDNVFYERNNQSPISKEDALELIKKRRGHEFDPILVDIFVENIDEILSNARSENHV